MKRSGVTLIALVITVIVLLILAGTAIAMGVSGDGLFEKSDKSVKRWNLSEKNEEIQLYDYFAYVEDITLEAWDGTVGTNFASGEGTEEFPYIIENGEQLAYFAKTINEGQNYANEYISITKSINLGMHEFTPAGAYLDNHFFNGNLNGNGNIITGINIDLPETSMIGLIGVLDTNGKISNVKLGNGNINGYQFVGGLVAFNKGTVANCSSSLDVSGKYYSGGVVGENRGSVTNCYNTGNISSSYSSGGIVGYLESGSIKGCINNGNVWTKEGNNAGGITAYIQSGEISGCTNNGKIWTTEGHYTGGISGYIQSGNVSNCNNYGTIIADTSYAGGITGLIAAGTISLCDNNGEIKTNNNQAGGIVGALRGASIADCSNNNTVTANNFAGGIVATISIESSTVYNVYNSGSVISEGNKVAGGIVAAGTKGILERAYNKGETTGSITGGIYGAKTGGTTLNTYYYTLDSNLKGIGSSSTTEKIDVDDVPGQVDKETRLFNSRSDFLNSVNS
ncbi:MAG: hypothetical protein IKP28_03720 [Clostridia bacterium]|nr:hypothetical protein [Clostridia bacterium]